MRLFLLSLIILVSSFTDGVSAPNDSLHVVLVVWDGMRSDFINQQYAPTLYRLASRGVYFPIIIRFISALRKSKANPVSSLDNG